MPTTTTPSEHLSIGEVLATLRDEFPDITISKIRFLESQGLIDPERTPSGYRKFYGPDIDRLRWILHQQKENFLPLKVIKGRLEEAGPDELPDRRRPRRRREPEPRRRRRKAAAKAGEARPRRRRAAAKTADAAEDADGDAPSSRPSRGTKSARAEGRGRSPRPRSAKPPERGRRRRWRSTTARADDLEPTASGAP